METGFYVVWNPEGGAPRVRHDSLDGATNEANRLARMNPGQSFFVLQALRRSERVDVRTVDLETPENAEFPF